MIFLNLLFFIGPWLVDLLISSPGPDIRIEHQYFLNGETARNERSNPYTKSDLASIDSGRSESVSSGSGIEPEVSSNKQIELVDLNSADSINLVGVYGIGPVMASRIIKFRDALGGFYSKAQLAEVYGISQDYLPEILEQVKVDASKIQKIDVNAADFKVLFAHPYVNYDLADAILDRRYELNLFAGPGDLFNPPLADSTLLNKLLPYLNFD